LANLNAPVTTTAGAVKAEPSRALLAVCSASFTLNLSNLLTGHFLEVFLCGSLLIDHYHFGDTTDPEQHPIAIALRRQDDVDDGTKNETLVVRMVPLRCPDKRLFKQLQKTLT
jgi:hypothetical protein